MNVIAIFDIGRTNKKFFLVNEQYRIVYEEAMRFDEIMDEDGFPCDDLKGLSRWVLDMVKKSLGNRAFSIKAFNCAAYGASFVHLDEKGEAVTPLYNYLKPFPPELRDRFYKTYGTEEDIAVATASPPLGNLNSGLQLYWLKYTKPNWYRYIQYSLHLPQYISSLISGQYCAEITSIGCHTALWDFEKEGYHEWVYAEKIQEKFPPLGSSDSVKEIMIGDAQVRSGVGLHDSSAALVPYLASFSEPFILLSTGTWCISLNPFDHEPLTTAELEQDCLCYMQYSGRPVKASRLFAGHEHEEQLKTLAKYFKVPVDQYEQVRFTPSLLHEIDTSVDHTVQTGIHPSPFMQRDITVMKSYEIAYHQLIFDIIRQQQQATSLVFSSTAPKRIFVDGGFARNPVYMHLLAAAFPQMEVYAASVSQASAIGAALAIHDAWNKEPMPGDIVQLTYYTKGT